MPHEHHIGWTEGRIALLRKLWSEGLSCSQIAKQLGGGVSRNGVIGKIHRLGLNIRATPARPVKPKPKPIGPTRRQRIAPSKPLPPTPPPEPIADATGARITILTLNESTCKFPHGDPMDADFAFCGRVKVGGSPYCIAHDRIAYQPSQPRRRRERDVTLKLRQAIAAAE